MRSSGCGGRSWQLAGLARVDDDAAVHDLGHLGWSPAQPVQGVRGHLFQLDRVPDDVGEDGSLARDRGRARRAAILKDGDRIKAAPLCGAGSGAPRAALCVGTPARHARAVPAIAVRQSRRVNRQPGDECGARPSSLASIVPLAAAASRPPAAPPGSAPPSLDLALTRPPLPRDLRLRGRRAGPGAQ
jgi:hypothetical protein